MRDHPIETLSLYVDGALEPEAMKQVEAHLRTCDRCRREVEWLQAVARALESAPLREVPGDLADPIMEQILAFEARRRYPQVRGPVLQAARGLVRVRIGDLPRAMVGFLSRAMLLPVTAYVRVFESVLRYTVRRANRILSRLELFQTVRAYRIRVFPARFHLIRPEEG